MALSLLAVANRLCPIKYTSAGRSSACTASSPPRKFKSPKIRSSGIMPRESLSWEIRDEFFRRRPAGNFFPRPPPHACHCLRGEGKLLAVQPKRLKECLYAFGAELVKARETAEAFSSVPHAWARQIEFYMPISCARACQRGGGKVSVREASVEGLKRSLGEDLAWIVCCETQRREYRCRFQ